MGIFERYLSIWVGLSILVGVLLGELIPGVFNLLASFEVAKINLVIAVLIWVMIYPMMLQIDFSAIKDVGKQPKGLIMTLVINWLIKPFSMVALGWLFFKIFFSQWISPAAADEYIAGLILLGVAPCTAMVFVWSQLTKGDPNYTLVQVSLNDIIMVFAYAPIAGFLLGISNIQVPWDTLVISIGLYVVLPLLAGIASRKALAAKPQALPKLLGVLKPWSILGLLGTVVLLFGFQANNIVQNPVTILLIAAPLLVQSYGVFLITWLCSRALKLPHSIAAPACLIGTSNFFELAVAVAIGLYGLNSGAALATVVGVLVEVPVMLSLVAFANRFGSGFIKG